MEQKYQLSESELLDWQQLAKERDELGEKISDLYSQFLRLSSNQEKE